MYSWKGKTPDTSCKKMNPSFYLSLYNLLKLECKKENECNWNAVNCSAAAFHAISISYNLIFPDIIGTISFSSFHSTLVNGKYKMRAPHEKIHV